MLTSFDGWKKVVNLFKRKYNCLQNILRTGRYLFHSNFAFFGRKLDWCLTWVKHMSIWRVLMCYSAHASFNEEALLLFFTERQTKNLAAMVEKNPYLLVYSGTWQKESNSVRTKKATEIWSNLFVWKGYIYSFYKSPVTKKDIEIRKLVKSENETPRYLWIKRREGGGFTPSSWIFLQGKILRNFIFAHRSSPISDIRKNSVYASNILVWWVDEWRRVKLQSLYPASLIDLPKSCIV